MAVEVIHPHIGSSPDILGGRPVIRGTRFPVKSLVVYVLQHGMTPEEVVRDWPYLSLAQVYDAISYYYDNREAVDNDMEQDEEFWRLHANGNNPVLP
jgi:uncharacterized protein (DUF433 family)